MWLTCCRERIWSKIVINYQSIIVQVWCILQYMHSSYTTIVCTYTHISAYIITAYTNMIIFLYDRLWSLLWWSDTCSSYWGDDSEAWWTWSTIASPGPPRVEAAVPPLQDWCCMDMWVQQGRMRARTDHGAVGIAPSVVYVALLLYSSYRGSCPGCYVMRHIVILAVPYCI